MTGLETIVEQILQEARQNAEEISAKADRNVDSIIANAKKTVDKMNAESAEKLAQAEKAGAFRAKSSSELKKRQAVLRAKQAIINDMLDKAYAQMVSLPDEEYFGIILKCLENSVQKKKGTMIFSARDRKRLTPDVEAEIGRIATAHGGSLDISDECCDLEGGFILSYGGIEENCSFKALFDANKESLADKVNHFLFADSE